jgi:thioredoxin reductase (NADPH)
MSDNHYKVIIIGSGPAGLTAGIYTARANFNPIIFEGIQPGGQLTITNDIENFPGFEDGISGPALMDTMRKQMLRFGGTSVFKEITEVDFTKRPFVVKSNDEVYTADSVVVATGASAKYLGLESEKKFMGFGVSACATCDGFFFRGLKVLVVGGGDTAMEEALHLTKFASEVSIIHRRDEFRASQIMLDRVKKNPKIKLLTSKTVKEVFGTEEANKKTMTGVILQDTKTGELQKIEADGLFLGIGHQPNTLIFKGILDMDESGYLKVQPGSTRTNIEGVFAAGDVADSVYRQAITAAGTGCMAALDAGKWLEAQE